MPYKPVIGGSIYNRHIATAGQHSAKIRRLIAEILQDGDKTALYMRLTAIALLTTNIDQALDDLAAYNPDQENTP